MVVKINDICNKIERIRKIVEKEEDVSIDAIREKCEEAFLTFHECDKSLNHHGETIACLLEDTVDMMLDDVVRAVFGDKSELERKSSTKIGTVDVNRLELSDKITELERKVTTQINTQRKGTNVYEVLKEYVSLLNFHHEMIHYYDDEDEGMQRFGQITFVWQQSDRVYDMVKEIARYIMDIYERQWDPEGPYILWNENTRMFDEDKIWAFDTYNRGYDMSQQCLGIPKSMKQVDEPSDRVNPSQISQSSTQSSGIEDNLQILESVQKLEILMENKYNSLKDNVEDMKAQMNDRLAEARLQQNNATILLQETKDIIMRINESRTTGTEIVKKLPMAVSRGIQATSTNENVTNNEADRTVLKEGQ